MFVLLGLDGLSRQMFTGSICKSEFDSDDQVKKLLANKILLRDEYDNSAFKFNFSFPEFETFFKPESRTLFLQRLSNIGINDYDFGNPDADNESNRLLNLAYQPADRIEKLANIIGGYNNGDLQISGIPHSAASWTTIYTGVGYRKHEVYEFWYYKNEEDKKNNFITYYKPEDIKAPTIWELLTLKGKCPIIYNFCGIAPPYNYRCKPEPLEVSWPHHVDGVIANFWYQELMFKDFINRRTVDFLGFTNTAPDRLWHFQRSGKIDKYRYLESMNYFTNFLCNILKMIEDGGHKFLAVSDHGVFNGGFWHETFDGWRVPIHKDRGIWFSNIEGLTTIENTKAIKDIVLSNV